jgi:hypothetical protein
VTSKHYYLSNAYFLHQAEPNTNRQFDFSEQPLIMGGKALILKSDYFIWWCYKKLPEVEQWAIFQGMLCFNRHSLTSIVCALDKFSMIYQLGSSGILPQNTNCQKYVLLEI